MQRLLDETKDEPTTTGRQRVAIILGALAVTSVLFGLAYLLGTWAYAFRLQSSHEARLARVLAQKPTGEQITQGLALQGDTLLAAPSTSGDLTQAIERWGGQRGQEIRTMFGRWGKMRVYQASEMVYFIYFDAGDIMQGFTCVRQR
jgi:hypothetical protein